MTLAGTLSTLAARQRSVGLFSVRRFINALIVPRVDKTYDAEFELTPVEFEAVFRHCAERQSGSAIR